MKFYSPLILIFLIVILFYGTAFAQPADKESYLIKINEHFDKSAFEKQKGEIRSQTGNIISVWLPKENVDSVKAMKGVEVVSPARKIQPLLNKAVRNGNVDKVWDGTDLPQGYSGKNVIIGFTDWGFDYTHPSFYDTNLLDYRVLRAWDQFRQAGPPPIDFTYGTELIGKEALLEAQCDTSNIYGHHYHGTHVASIAGGSGAHTVYRGVAYDANLLFATFLVDEASVMDAFNWMKRVAEEEEKRLVINMSWGLYYMDNPDGKGPLNDVIETLSDEGIVFVSSAGNNGDVNFHVDYDFQNSTDTLKTQIEFFNYPTENYWGQCISMISCPNHSFNFKFSVLNSGYQKIADSPIFNTCDGDSEIDTFFLIANDTIFYRVSLEKRNPYNDRPKAYLHIKKPTPTNYKFALVAFADSGHFHAWNVVELTSRVGNWGTDFSAPLTGWKAGDNKCGVSTPGTQERSITVAAHSSGVYNSDYNWLNSYIAYFSSSGPTIDGRMKPEISAPGSNVISAISSFTDHDVGSPWATVTFEGREYEYVPLSGTSMSSPYVAGVVALLLQANPLLSALQVQQILHETAYQDRYTTEAGIDRFGYGKVDAFAAVLKALNTVGIDDFTTSQLSCSIFPNPTTDKFYLTLLSDCNYNSVEIFDFSGRLVNKKIVPSGVHEFNMGNCASGYYFIKISNKNSIITKKLIKE